MATQPRLGLSYADLQAFPEDDLRRELIDGELFVTPSPVTRHQRVVGRLYARLSTHCEAHGGDAFVAPLDVYFSDRNVVVPDVLYVGADHADRVEKQFIRGAPDVVVEVSSPSTRRLEILRKRELYERFGVPEYWYVDLDADRVEVYRLGDGRYGVPTLLGRHDALRSELVPGFSLSVDELLGPPED